MFSALPAVTCQHITCSYVFITLPAVTCQPYYLQLCVQYITCSNMSTVLPAVVFSTVPAVTCQPHYLQLCVQYITCSNMPTYYLQLCVQYITCTNMSTVLPAVKCSVRYPCPVFMYSNFSLLLLSCIGETWAYDVIFVYTSYL